MKMKWIICGLALICSNAMYGDGWYAYVTNQTDQTISPIDLSTNTVLPPISFGDYQPYNLAITPDGSTAYVACFFKMSLSLSISLPGHWARPFRLTSTLPLWP